MEQHISYSIIFSIERKIISENTSVQNCRLNILLTRCFKSTVK